MVNAKASALSTQWLWGAWQQLGSGPGRTGVFRLEEVYHVKAIAQVCACQAVTLSLLVFLWFPPSNHIPGRSGRVAKN